MTDSFIAKDNSASVQKDKDARVDYSFDWSDWLSPGDSIASSVWQANDPAMIVSSSSLAGAIATAVIGGGEPGTWYFLINTVTSAQGLTDQAVLKVFVALDQESEAPMGSALFPNKLTAVAAVRADRLAVAAGGALPDIEVSDDYIWDKLLAAEADLQRDLRVFFQPTVIIPDDAPQSEVDALATAGIPYAQEGAYDFSSDFFQPDNWGFIVTNHRPLISVQSVKLVYPQPGQNVFEIPKDWIRLDRKYGHIRMVPTGSAAALPLGAMTLTSLAGSMSVPFMVQVRYTAGLTNAARLWPDLVDLVKKKAVLGIIGDVYLPQSGSISADGLSQSMSVDMQKYADSIDLKINGTKGSNGGLMTAIHGVRGMVF